MTYLGTCTCYVSQADERKIDDQERRQTSRSGTRNEYMSQRSSSPRPRAAAVAARLVRFRLHKPREYPFRGGQCRAGLYHLRLIPNRGEGPCVFCFRHG